MEVSNRKDVSESAFEFLLAELFALAQHGAENAADDLSDSANTVAVRLDNMGFHVGYRFTEKILASQKLLGTEYLDVIKFICKEFWEEVFKKKVNFISSLCYDGFDALLVRLTSCKPIIEECSCYQTINSSGWKSIHLTISPPNRPQRNC